MKIFIFKKNESSFIRIRMEMQIMSELKAYGSEVKSIFQLIGTKENDITKSIAWTLANCPMFQKMIIKEIFNIDIEPNEVRIKYQEFEKNKGITDLELTDDKNFYMIIEAKKGLLLPNKDQLTLYSNRKTIRESIVDYKAIVSMSECSKIYAQMYLPINEVNGIPILHLSWRNIYDIVNESRKVSCIKQRHLLNELMQYLEGIMTMQVKTSNWVYIVALKPSKPDDCNLTWIEIVERRMKYFHPMGENGWPKEPPNYIAFRYGGQLQSIHHIEDYIVTRNLHEEISEMPDIVNEKAHFVYKLGAKIVPTKIVRTGKIYKSGRKWAMLDTLLTADTIADACDISKARMDSRDFEK
ncbi:MAG: hypothetical protein RR201_03020 [Malacoplasma sp.]